MDYPKYRNLCSTFTQYTKKGRGGIYLGENEVFGANLFGQQLITDVRHSPSLKMMFCASPVDASIFAYMVNIISTGAVCIDVDAGCGCYTLFMAALAGPNGTVYSFETVPECLKLIQKNTQFNDLHTVHCVDLWVSNETAIMKKAYFGGNYQFFFQKPFHNAPKEIEVKSTTLDNYFQERETSIDFIKINREDSLAQIFDGMQEILLFNPDVKILCPFNPVKIAETGRDPKAFLDDLEKQGFKIRLFPKLDIIDKEHILSCHTTKSLLLARTL